MNLAPRIISPHKLEEKKPGSATEETQAVFHAEVHLTCSWAQSLQSLPSTESCGMYLTTPACTLKIEFNSKGS